MTGHFRDTYSGIKGVLKHEGVKSLISRGLVFLLHRTFWTEAYFVISTDLEKYAEENREDFLPKKDNYFSRIISTNQEADELVARGYELGAYELNFRASLDRDITVFCIFIEKELAHIVCLADNPRGKEFIDPIPFEIDFQNGEAVTGRALTMPKFRRLHLRTYSGYLLRRYCLDNGIRRIKGTLRVDNYPAMVSMAQRKYHFAVARCRYIKILWFKYLKETKMEPTPVKLVYEQMAKR
jgi:hypothetical protein